MKGDFKLDEDFEMEFYNGDFLVSDNTQQDVNLIVNVNPGQIRPLLTYGVGAEDFLNSNEALSFKRKVIEQCKKIDVKINKVYVDIDSNEWSVEISVKKINS